MRIDADEKTMLNQMRRAMLKSLEMACTNCVNQMRIQMRERC